jgi:hypothetical protein
MHTIQHLLSEIGTASWQDLTLSVGNIFFSVTLIPMLRRPERPPLLTCIPTGLALLAGGFVFASLHLWLTALTQTITGLQWLALAVKRPPGGAPSLLRDSDESPGRTRRPGHRKWPPMETTELWRGFKDAFNIAGPKIERFPRVDFHHSPSDL